MTPDRFQKYLNLYQNSQYGCSSGYFEILRTVIVFQFQIKKNALNGTVFAEEEVSLIPT